MVKIIFSAQIKKREYVKKMALELLEDIKEALKEKGWTVEGYLKTEKRPFLIVKVSKLLDQEVVVENA